MPANIEFAIIYIPLIFLLKLLIYCFIISAVSFYIRVLDNISSEACTALLVTVLKLRLIESATLLIVAIVSVISLVYLI